MNIKINKLVSGALTRFRGYGDFIASTGGAEKTMRMIEFAGRMKSAISGIFNSDDLCRKYPHFWFACGTEKTFLILHQERYTRFPENNRFYDQNIFAWMNTAELEKVNLGDFFSSAKLFQQYSEEQLGKLPDLTEIEHQETSVSRTLVDKLSATVSENKKLLIEISTDELEIKDNDALNFHPFKKLFYALSVLPIDIRRQIGISTKVPYENFPKVKVEKGKEPIIIPKQEAYYLLWNGNSCSENSLLGFAASLIGKADYYKEVPETTEMKMVYEMINFQDFGAPPTRVLINYGKVSDREKLYFQKNDFEIIGQEILM